VVDALLALIHGGNLRPTAREVADAAGVSLRSVYVHFDDVESLFVAASARHYEHVQQLMTPCDPTAALDDRITALVEQRLRIYRDGAQLRRAALVQEPFSPVLRKALDYGRRAARGELDTVFAPELAAVDEPARARLRAALDIATSFATWETLVGNNEVGEAEIPELVEGLVHAALAAWGAVAAPGTSDTPDTPAPAGTTAGPTPMSAAERPSPTAEPA
jgi:TetR/AcrR family transcriptional regulator of autoinduction and epiphytic fitness